jgi:transcriptional regulator with XRE-family HTH domain
MLSDSQKVSFISTPGARLKSVRMLVAQSRSEFEKNLGISENTLAAWESGKAPLSQKGAQRFVEAVRKYNVHCTVAWLLHGTGLPPMTRHNKKMPSYASQSSEDHTETDEEVALAKEIAAFQSNYSDAIVVLIVGDAMEPWYKHGDYVGGRKMAADKASSLVGSHCIVETESGDIFVRLLNRSKSPQAYILSSSNPHTTEENPVVYNVSLKFAAKVIWHRRRSS